MRVGRHRAARAEFQALLRAATQRRFDVVVFWALDRLTRDVPKKGGFGIVGRLTRNSTKIQGVRVVYVYSICTLCGPATASKLLILRRT